MHCLLNLKKKPRPILEKQYKDKPVLLIGIGDLK